MASVGAPWADIDGSCTGSEPEDHVEGVSSDEERVESTEESTEGCTTSSVSSMRGHSAQPNRSRISWRDTSDEQATTEAPPLDRTQFDSWQDLEAYLQEYMSATFQSFRVRTNDKVEMRNKKIRATGSKQPLVPEEWVYYGKTFVGTHAFKYKSRGQGKRKRQQSRALECSVQINACVQVVDPLIPSFTLRITSAKLDHNHTLSRHTYAQYSHNRTALELEVVDTVNTLLKAGAKKKRILQYINDHSSCSPTSMDVHNLVRKLKKQQHTAPTSAKRLKQWMIEFSEEPGNIGRIFVDSVQNKTIATCITLQTRHMRELFDRFPEVLMIDATHGTNVSKYKGNLYNTLLSKNERAPTLMTALQEFKKNNPAWTRVKCILIDKDFTKIGVLKQVFSGVILLLCQFHVLKYLREQIASSEYGFTSWQKQQLLGIVNMLVYARTEREFGRVREYMRHIMSVDRGSPVLESRTAELGMETAQLGTGTAELGMVTTQLGVGGVGRRNDEPLHPFDVYFTKNWDNCRPMWCSFERQNCVTLGNNTNNRLEASWKQLKDLVDSFVGVDECIASIMCYHAQAEKMFLDCVYNLSVVHNPKYDAEMRFLSNLVSEHACELVYEQYTFAIGRGNYKFHEAVPGVYLIQYDSDEEDALDEPQSEYSVTKKDWSCSCLFMCSRLLPCRHVLFIRKALNFETIIPTQTLNSRWLMASLRLEPHTTHFTGDAFRVSSVLKDTNPCWDCNRKFREANLVSSSISEHLSGLGMRDYRVAMKMLQGVASFFKHGDYEAILKMTESQDHSRSDDAISGNDAVDEVEITLDGMDSSSHEEHEQTHSSRSVAQSSCFSVQTTQTSTASNQLGTSTTELGTDTTELGTDTTELGTSSGEMGTGGAESATDHAAVEEATSGSTTESSEVQTRTLALSEGDFEIQSPPKSRGRPRNKPKTVKVKRKPAVAMIQEDLEMHHNQLNLLVLFETLEGIPTYKSAAEKLLQFKLFVFVSKPKPPVVHEMKKLPRTKQLIRPEEIIRVFPKDLIAKCTGKVIAYQSKHPGTQEMHLALEILGVGVFAYSTVVLMKRWHEAINAVKRIETTMNWIGRVDYAYYGNSSFYVEEDPDIISLVESLPILSSVETETLDLGARFTISAEAMQTVLTKLFGGDPNVIVVDPSLVGVVNGSISTEQLHFRRALTGVTNSTKVLVPINCNNNHWCAVLMDLSKNRAHIYDSMPSSYLNSVRAVAHTLIMLIPEHYRPSSRLVTHDPGLGIQTDSYNCGVYVLLAFEMFCGSEPLGNLNKKTLQCLRYRYLRMCLKD